MWIIIPLIYVMSWRFCHSIRQAFQETFAWIVGYLGTAAAVLALDVGGLEGVNATPDSPGAAIAILGGFVGMIISHYRWKKRGGDPVRPPGTLQRTLAAMRGNNTSNGNAPRRAPAQQGPRVSQPAMSTTTQGRAQQKSAPAGKWQRAFGAMLSGTPKSGTASRKAPPATRQQPVPPPQQRPAPQPQPSPPPAGNPVPNRARQANGAAPNASSGKYAKATGRALGAMFRKPSPKQRR